MRASADGQKSKETFEEKVNRSLSEFNKPQKENNNCWGGDDKADEVLFKNLGKNPLYYLHMASKTKNFFYNLRKNVLPEKEMCACYRCICGRCRCDKITISWEGSDDKKSIYRKDYDKKNPYDDVPHIKQNFFDSDKYKQQIAFNTTHKVKIYTRPELIFFY